MAVTMARLGGATRRYIGSNGVVLALLATFLWSTTGIFIEVLGRDYTLKPVTLSFWRSFLLTGLLALIVARRQGRAGFRVSWGELRYLLFNSLIGIGLFGVFWSGSVQTNGTAVATTLLYTSPIFVALGGWLVLHEGIGWGRVAAIVISVVGCALVAGAYDVPRLLGNPTGVLLGLGSGFTFGCYTLGSKLWSGYSQRDPFSTLFYLFGFSLILLLPWGLLETGPTLLTPGLDWVGWLLVIVAAYGPTLGGYSLYNLSLRYLPVAVASLITTLEQPAASLLALWLLGHGLDAVQWLGGFMVVGSVVALQSRNLIIFKKPVFFRRPTK